MLTVKEHQFKTPIGKVDRATLMLDGKPIISYECTSGSGDSIAGLVLGVGKFKTEAYAAINKHLKETEDAK